MSTRCIVGVICLFSRQGSAEVGSLPLKRGAMCLLLPGGLYIQESVEQWLVVQWASSRLGGFGRWLVVGVWWWWQQWFLEGCELWCWR